MYLPQLQKKVTVNQSVRKPTTSVDRAHAWPCQNIGREGMLRCNHREMQIWTTMENWLSSGMKESDGIEFQHVNKISMFAPEWKQNCIEAYVYVYIYIHFSWSFNCLTIYSSLLCRTVPCCHDWGLSRRSRCHTKSLPCSDRTGPRLELLPRTHTAHQSAPISAPYTTAKSMVTKWTHQQMRILRSHKHKID